MSEPVQLGKTWMHAKERRKLLKNCAIGSIFRFWTKKWTCEKVNFCCDWRGSYLMCLSQWGSKKHECTRKNDENPSIIERSTTSFALSGRGTRSTKFWIRIRRRQLRHGYPVMACLNSCSCPRKNGGVSSKIERFTAVFLFSWSHLKVENLKRS